MPLHSSSAISHPFTDLRPLVTKSQCHTFLPTVLSQYSIRMTPLQRRPNIFDVAALIATQQNPLPGVARILTQEKSSATSVVCTNARTYAHDLSGSTNCVQEQKLGNFQKLVPAQVPNNQKWPWSRRSLANSVLSDGARCPPPLLPLLPSALLSPTLSLLLATLIHPHKTVVFDCQTTPYRMLHPCAIRLVLPLGNIQKKKEQVRFILFVPHIPSPP